MFGTVLTNEVVEWVAWLWFDGGRTHWFLAQKQTRVLLYMKINKKYDKSIDGVDFYCKTLIISQNGKLVYKKLKYVCCWGMVFGLRVCWVNLQRPKLERACDDVKRLS